MTASADGVKVYDAPDDRNGRLVATLARGQKVDVIEKSANDAGADTGSTWYRIKDPAGWVNGTFLASAN
jgi:hypothetical protein